VLRKWQRYVKQGHWLGAESQFRFAFEMLVHSYHRAVIGFCVNMLGQWASQAEDLAQEVFLALWKTLPQFRQEASLRTWVFTIARYQCFECGTTGGAA
jgi:RNA polymerase sigma factor (sigma-70 family)